MDLFEQLKADKSHNDKRTKELIDWMQKAPTQAEFNRRQKIAEGEILNLTISQANKYKDAE